MSSTRVSAWFRTSRSPARASVGLTAAAMVLVGLAGAQQTPPQQPSEITTTITSGNQGTPPRYAVPDFIALTEDPETVEAVGTIAQVLWNDLAFEREFAMIPRDTYVTIPPARSLYDVPLDRWRELNADGVVIGTVRRMDDGVHVELRLIHVRTRETAFSQQYEGPLRDTRAYAHKMSDDIHRSQAGLRGVARTKLTFNSDRDTTRALAAGESRGKEIYISDYDGENTRRITTQRALNITSVWSPDARSIAYVSWRRGPPNIFVSNIYEGTLVELTSKAENNWTPAYAPDGRLAFASNRDGNSEIYVMNADGSNVRRLTNHPASDITPTWSPTGNQIAFTSDRGGASQIYLMDADGLNVRRLTSESAADRATWSPAPFNEIAYAARTGPGYDIKVMDLATRTVRQLTFGEGTNESPSFAPNGRHLAFASTRAGNFQIFTIARDGRNVRQMTRQGNNYQPGWSQ